MSKIVQAVNAMIVQPDRISNVVQGQNSELFFLFGDRHKWSMRRGDDEQYFLWYYPGEYSIDELSSFDGHDWEGVAMVSYKTVEIGTKEAIASFAELYRLLKERIYGMNGVLDEIISSST